MARRGLAILLRLALLVVAFWLSAAPAQAHATLIASEPADGAVLAAPPPFVSLSFNEPVSPLVLRLIGPDQAAFDLAHPADRHEWLQAAMPSGLGRGTHVLSWRVVSLDGHPVGGTVVFSVGEPSARPSVTQVSDPSAVGALWITRVLLYLGLFVGIGGAFFDAWIARSRDSSPLVRGLICIGAGATLLSIPLQGIDALGLRPSGIVSRDAWLASVRTSFGTTAIAALMALAVAWLGSLARVSSTRRALTAIALVGAGLALASSGHASAASPQWLMRPAVFVHALALCFWIGALVPLARLARHDQDKGGLGVFSVLAPWAIAGLALSGTALAIVQVERPVALIGTVYGRILLAKIVCFALLMVLAIWNRVWLTPAVLAGRPIARRRLTRSIVAECIIVLIIFSLVAAWRFTAPPRALVTAAEKPLLVHIHTGEGMADILFEPGRVGVVRAVIVPMTTDFAALDAKEVHLTVGSRASGVEPVSRPAAPAGEGRWQVDAIPLVRPGKWEVRIDVLVDDFRKIILEGAIDLPPP